MAKTLSIAELNLLACEEEPQSTAWDVESHHSKAAPRRPADELEMSLLRLMLDSLDMQGATVGVCENFFSLGGDSAVAMRLCAAARAVGVPLTVAMIFQHPTVESMAHAVGLSCRFDQPHAAQLDVVQPFEQLKDSLDAETVCGIIAEQCEIAKELVQDAYPCTPLQQGMFLQSLISPGSYIERHCWNVPAPVDLALFKYAWEMVFKAFDALRTRFFEGFGDTLWQAVLREDLHWHSCDTLAIESGSNGLGMGLGACLCRFALGAWDDGLPGQRLVIDVHHAILDRWSVHVLEGAFARAYRGANISPQCQFHSFVGYVHTGDVEEHERYWKQQLNNYEGGPHPDIRSDEEKKPRCTTTLRTSIDSLRHSDFTVPEYLRAAWAIVTASHTKSNDVVLGVVEDGRDSPIFGIEDIVGPTIATVPVRIHLRSHYRVLDLMRSIRSQRVSMMPHRHFGLQNIAKLLPSAKVACDLQNRIDIHPSKSASFKKNTISLDYVGIEVQVQDCPLVLDCNLEEKHIEFVLDHSLTVLSRMQAREMLGKLAAVFEQLKQASSVTEIRYLQADEEPLHLLSQRGLETGVAVKFWQKHLALPADVRRLSKRVSKDAERCQQTLVGNIQLGPAAEIRPMPPTWIFAAWALTVSAYLESEDVVFGSGPAKTPTRVVIDRNEDLHTFVQRLTNESAERMAFEWLGTGHIQSLNEDCKAACDFETTLRLYPVKDANSTRDVCAPSAYLIEVLCRPSESDFKIEFVFDSSRIEQSRALRMKAHFERMLRQLMECMWNNSAAKVGELDLISPSDKEEVMRWNSAPYSVVDACVHEKVHAQALLSPDAPAIEAWDATFTYRELDDLSTRMGAYLIESGAGEKPIIPLCFNKSAWTVVAMLAVLKVGGAYVALDTSHPHDRLKLLVERTRASTVLVAPDFAALFEPLVKRVVVVAEPLRKELLLRPASQKLRIARPKDTALICFTSGSTGFPKGVMIQHDALCTFAAMVGPEMDLSPRSRVLQFAGYAFDVSNGEIFQALMHGGCCCIPSDYERMNDLAGVVGRMGINHLTLTPTVAGMVSPDDLGLVETLILGGEAIRQDHIDRFAHRFRMIGAYGPAEGTVWASINRFHPDSEPTTIGASGAGCHMWLVDPMDHDRLAPIGTLGEILLEGPMVAQGYLFDEAKTKAAFIEPPKWARDSGGEELRRFYKVGDLARQRADGALDFVGRKDTQVKLRGQRFELGEVEYQISTWFDGAAAVAADIVPLGKQSKALAAFFCPSSDLNVQFENNVGSMTAKVKEKLQELRNELTKKLPSVMVPSFYMPLERLPTSLSRKLDRKKLRQAFESLSVVQRQLYSIHALG